MFPYVNRAVNSGKQCVLRNLTAFSILENKGKCRFLIVNPGWTWTFTPGKHLWTPANKPSVNRPVNCRKEAFSGIHRNGKIPDNGTNTQSPTAKQLENLGFYDRWTPVNVSKCHILRKFTARFLQGKRQIFCRVTVKGIVIVPTEKDIQSKYVL